MPLTNNLKVQVDTPVWEWCRFAPVSTNAISSLTTGNTLNNRYLYYQTSSTLYRYDTYSDSWNQLASMTNFTTPTIMNNNVLINSIGHYGRAISSGGANNTIQLAGLSGKILKGYKIRIIAGKGAGQERTITDVSAPIIADRGIVTTAGTNSISDASTGIGFKAWKFNQYRDYQFRCDFGTGRTQLRPILYNSNNTIVWTDINYVTVNSWAQCTMPITVPVNSLYTIESHIATVNTNWTTNPDSTTQFMIVSGGIWNITQGTTSAPFFSLSYYDILADMWFGKSSQSGLKTAVFTAGSDLCLERITETGGTIFTETASGGGARFVTATSALTPMKYANFEIRIVSGTGAGQSRTILSNSATRINTTRDFDIAPNATSVYEIWRDVGKLWLIGGGDAGMLQYSQIRDQWTTGKQLDDGQCNQLGATRSGQEPFALTSITRITASITGINTTPIAGGAGYNINDILTLGVGTGGTVRVTNVDAVGAVTAITLETVGTNYTVATQTTTVAPAGGVGCTIAVTSIDFSELAVTPINHNFLIGDTVTITGATGTSAGKFNGTYTIIGVPSLTQFSYCSVGDPTAGSATIANSPSTTQVVDCTKNWAVNEHVGKIVQLSNNVLLGTGQQRRIVSNTATTLVWTLPATAPVNGTSRYVIEDIKPFGTDRTMGGQAGGGTEGFATGGSTTTLIDTTKTWIPNYWARTVGRKLRIVEGTGVGNEITIVSNTATTLTFLTQSFTPDTTTRYVIMDTFGTVSGAGGISTLSATPTVAGTGYAVGDIFAITGGTAYGQVMVASGGIPSVIRLIDGGVSGYTVVTGVATTNITGTGIGLTVNVTAITAIGSTTVMQDNTKNWDTNVLVGKRLRFLSGTSAGNEYTIVSNTFNTITTAIGTAPDNSTAYAILESSPRTNGIHLDNVTGSTDTTINHKYMYSFNGTATTELSRYDITTEHWELLSYFPQFETLTTGSMYVYDGKDRIYFTKDITGRVMSFDLTDGSVENSGTIPYGHSTAVSGNRMEIIQTADGLKYLYIMRQSATEMWRTLLFF